MLIFVVRRLLYSIPVLIAASFLIFTFTVTTADPLSTLKEIRNVNQNALVLITKEKHLDDPVIVRYGYWVRDAVTNKFGTTIIGDRPIWNDLKRVIPHTLQLVIICGDDRHPARDRDRRLLGVTPVLAVRLCGYLFQLPGAGDTRVLARPDPAGRLHEHLPQWDVRIFYTAQLSSVDPGHGIHFLVDRAQHLVLPVIVLVTGQVAIYSRFMRASMLEVINSDYIRTARAKGLAERRTIMKHAFRNALIPLTTLVGINLGALIGGAVITETIFALDGMGLYFVHALTDGDPYPLMAWLMVTAVIIIIGNLVADIAYGYLDPRIRLE